MDPDAADGGNVMKSPDSMPDSTSLRREVALARERDAALTAAAAERERNLVLIRQCDAFASEVFTLRKKYATAAQETRELREQLVYAQATICNMERSLFWRMRLVWVRIRSVFRRPRC